LLPSMSTRAAAAAPCASPLVATLDAGVQRGTMLRHPNATEPVYVSFANYGDLVSSSCAFVPMNSNRVINEAVVKKRVDENLMHYRRLDRYLDFGEISVLVRRDDPSMNFHIMDGQHRCRAMQELHKKHPNQALWFHFRVHVVANEKEAHDSLVHFQDQYPADPRAFLRSQRHTRFATEVVTQLNERYPRAFRAVVRLPIRGVPFSTTTSFSGC
jgi:hypothetical protein